MTKTASKTIAFLLHKVGLAVSVGLPASEVLRKFPIWRPEAEQPINGRSLGLGGILLIIIALFAFREKIWPSIKKNLRLNSLGSILFWGAVFALLIVVERFLIPVLPDLQSISLAGLIGALAGQACYTVAGLINAKE